jgi:putative sigma-54 modulation protein
MEVEFTARGVKISKAVRAHAEEGMERIGRILGRGAHGSVTFSVQRHLQIVELTVQARTQKLAATGKSNEPEAALRMALSHAENQARKYRDRKIENNRLPKEEKSLTVPPVARPKTRVSPDAEQAEGKPARGKARASIAVHSFPAKPTVVEPHIIKNGECFALKPLTIEEAVKDAEFRDRDLLIFHDPAGDMYVLHRRRDGQMELVEIS